MSKETNNHRNAPITLTLDGRDVDLLEDYLLQRARMWKVGSDLAEEEFPGEARRSLEIIGSRLADCVVLAVRQSGPTGTLAAACSQEADASKKYGAIYDET